MVILAATRELTKSTTDHLHLSSTIKIKNFKEHLRRALKDHYPEPLNIFKKKSLVTDMSKNVVSDYLLSDVKLVKWVTGVVCKFFDYFIKMPLTSAEKSKRYRDKLKQFHSDKYNEIKKKAAERAIKAYRRKVAKLTEEQKEEQRRKWREQNSHRNNQQIEQPTTSASQNDKLLEIASFKRNVQRRSQQNMEKEDTKHHTEMQNLKKGVNSLLRLMRNQQQQFAKVNKNTEDILKKLQNMPAKVNKNTKDILKKLENMPAKVNKNTEDLLKKLQKIPVADDPPDQQSDTGDDLSMYLKIPNKSSKTKPTADSPGQGTDKDEGQRHEGFSCSSCSNNIVGYRYTCVQCLNYDMCASCEARGAHCLHYVLRIPKPAPYAEVQSMLTAIRSHLLYGAEPEPEPEVVVPVEEVPLETIKVEIKEEAPDPLESDQALVTDDNYAAYSHETKKEYTGPEETISVSQMPYNTATSTGMIDNTLVIIENPVVSEPESKRRRANSPPPLVPSSSRVAPGPAYLAPASAHLAPGPAYISQTLTHKASGSAHLAPTSAHLAPGSALLAPAPARMAPAPDPAPGRMLDNIILYPQRKEPAAVEDKDESSSFQVFSHVKKKPAKSQATPGQRGGMAPASTSRSDDKK